jgi:hypothetical protein
VRVLREKERVWWGRVRANCRNPNQKVNLNIEAHVTVGRGSEGLVTQSPLIVASSFLSATMSSGATQVNRKRSHSLEQGGERVGSDINAKKPRVSSEASSNRSVKKKRGKKKRTVPVVEDIAGSSSTRSHDDGAELMSPEIQRRGGQRGKPRRVVESDEEEDANMVPWTPIRSQTVQKVSHSELPLFVDINIS